jgi:hypothetical protein
MVHECIVETRRDDLAHTELYLARCRCHESSWHVLTADELPYSCPFDLTRGPAGRSS